MSLHILLIKTSSFLAVKESQENNVCPWSALDCSIEYLGMTWSMLVYLEDQDIASDQTQMIVYSKDTASFYIDSDGKV